MASELIKRWKPVCQCRMGVLPALLRWEKEFNLQTDTPTLSLYLEKPPMCRECRTIYVEEV